jgi:hypothetical protein
MEPLGLEPKYLCKNDAERLQPYLVGFANHQKRYALSFLSRRRASAETYRGYAPERPALFTFTFSGSPVKACRPVY